MRSVPFCFVAVELGFRSREAAKMAIRGAHVIRTVQCESPRVYLHPTDILDSDGIITGIHSCRVRQSK
jgi:hypothetical protein